MSWNGSTLVVAMAVALMGASELQGQDEQTRRRGGPDMGPDVEAVMSMRDRLELTDAQVAALDELRAQAVERRSANQAAVEEMRSRLRAGEIDRDEMRAFREEMRTQRPAADERRAQLEAILDETQLQTLDELRDRRQGMRRGGGRPGALQRREAMRGRVGPRMERRGEFMQRRGTMLERRGVMLERRGAMLERRGEMLERRGRLLERRRRMPENESGSTGSP